MPLRLRGISHVDLGHLCCVWQSYHIIKSSTGKGLAMARIIEVKNPRSGQADYQIIGLGPVELSTLAQTARAAQREWLSRGMSARGLALTRFADAAETHFEDIAKALEVDTGRRQIARSEVSGFIGQLRGWAVQASLLMPADEWQQGRMKPNFKHMQDYVPYSLVGVISPWNFPLTLSFIDAIPALMAGACVMIKPSEVTPRFADALRPVIEDAGLNGIITFVQGGGDTGAALIDCVDNVCFTGSVPTGRKVAIAAAKNLIPANLELGGKDPMIITQSANIDIATTLTLRASVLATGQACQSIERVYVPRALYKDFTELLAAKAKEVRLTWPNIERGHIGPFIFDRQADIVAAQIAEAVQQGARVLSGGEILTHGGGRWLAPTVLADVTHEMTIMREETFGPVIPVMAYDTPDEAITLANDTEYGLSAAVFAGSIDEAKDIGNKINAGAISLMDGALTGQYFEAGKQAFGHSGLGPSRMGADGFLRFFRQKAYIANTVAPLTLDDFAEG